jgi:predicted metal-dependent peptidase
MLDMSCSVTDDEVRACVSNAAGIFQQLKPDYIQIVQFDTQIKSAHKVRNVRELKDLEFKGRGGTRISPVMEWIANNKPAVALVFSDGYFEKPINPKVPVIWLIHHNPEFTAPFGKVIHYTI